MRRAAPSGHAVRATDRARLKRQRRGRLRALPSGFLIALDCGPVFRQGEAHPDICIHVAVGNMVHQLAYGPPTGPIGGFELLLGETSDCGSQALRQLPYAFDGGASLLRSKRLRFPGATDRVAKQRELGGFRGHGRHRKILKHYQRLNSVNLWARWHSTLCALRLKAISLNTGCRSCDTSHPAWHW